MKTHTVLTIIGDNLVQEMLAVNLRQMGLLLTHEEDIQKANIALQSITPDLIILDSTGVTGQKIRQINQLGRHTRSYRIPVISLVEQNSSPDSGKEEWPGKRVVKPFAPRQLLDLIGSVLQANAVTAQETCLCVGEISLNPLTYRVSHGQAAIHLRPKEFLLLAFLMKHVDRVFNRGQLLDELWGNEVFVDERAVDVLVRRLRVALEPHGLAGWIETVRGAGYRFRAAY